MRAAKPKPITFAGLALALRLIATAHLLAEGGSEKSGRPDVERCLGPAVPRVGADARRDPSRRRNHPRDPAAVGRRPGGPGGTRRGGALVAGCGGGGPSHLSLPLGKVAVGRSRGATTPDGLGGLPAGVRVPRGRCAPARGQQGRRPDPALLHLRHHRAAQAGAAHPRVVPDRAPVHHVLDGAAAR